MTAETVPSTNISNLNATPVVSATPSAGGPAMLRVGDGNVTATTGATSTSVYQLVRLPSNARVKEAKIKLDATATTFTGDIGFYYSNSTVDGTPSSKQGTKVNGNTGAQLYGAATALGSQTTFLELTAGLAAAKFDKQLWDACGLTSDPHCPFDLCVGTTATNSGAPTVYAQVKYVGEG